MNKTAVLVLASLMVAGLLCGCLLGQETQDPPEAGAEAMKGFELYTWQENRQWYFSLVEGTNRLKTDEEILAFGQFLDGAGDLEDALKRLAPGQYVTWLELEKFPLPDEGMLTQVEQACQDLGLVCSVVR